MHKPCYWAGSKSVEEVKKELIYMNNVQKDFKIKINRDRIVAVSKKYRYKFLGKIESKNDNIVITGNLRFPLYLNLIAVIVFASLAIKIKDTVILLSALCFFVVAQLFFYFFFNIHYRIAPDFYIYREKLFLIIENSVCSSEKEKKNTILLAKSLVDINYLFK